MYNITNEVRGLRSYQYVNRRAKDTLSQMNSTTGIIVEPSVKRALMEQGFVFCDEVDNKSVYQPQKMFDALDRYATVQHVGFDPSAWDVAYALTLKAFGLRLNLTQETDFRKLALWVKAEKSSGAPEFGRKGDSLARDYLRMDKWLHYGKCPDPCVAYHRIQHGDEGPKTRLVWGYPQSVTLAEAGFARPLIDAFVDRRSVMAMGKTRIKLAAQMTAMLNAHAKYGLDMSRFDATISRPLIIMAFQILGSNFDWTRSSKEDWDKVRNYFIHTPILMPDGFVYIKHRGVPSGSYFTQLVDSVVNFFCIQYCFYLLTGKTIHPDRIRVLGDDSVFSSSIVLSLKDFASKLSGIGLSLNVKKSCLVLDEGNIEFLGHEWIHGLVDRNPRDIAQRMIFPERHSKIEDPLERIRTRIYPYLNDGTSAFKIVYNYQKHKTNLIPAMFSNIEIDWDHGQIGWKEHLSVTNEEPRVNRDMLIQAYVGLLR